MAKKKSAKRAGRGSDKRASKDAKADSSQSKDSSSGRATRETIESIVIAFVLAFLFRSFEAEAFVIPTGSMAPTLMGEHKDVVCEKCAYQYPAGASMEKLVGATTCPICGHTMRIEDKSFNGDRILVSKFAYEFAEPRRWDVIVFKYPGNPKQNYIKRLVGLPNETLKIRHGDIFVRKDKDPQDKEFPIERKPPHKLKAMLQAVHDTRHIAQDLVDAGWPSRWETWAPPGSAPRCSWTILNGGREFQITPGDGEPASAQVAWLRYRHVVPSRRDWLEIAGLEEPSNDLLAEQEWDPRGGQLICDYYAYNDIIPSQSKRIPRLEQLVGQALVDESAGRVPPRERHWVGDLALECDVVVENDRGNLLLDLVEGGRHYQCRIDVSNGQAVLSIDGGEVPFIDKDRSAGPKLAASTSVQGPGTYRLRFCNADDQLVLWVNEKVVTFTDPASGDAAPTTYANVRDCRPVWTKDDPGDLLPLGVGSQGASLRVTRLRVLRDIYYVAVRAKDSGKLQQEGGDYDRFERDVLRDPHAWSTTSLFANRRGVEFVLGEDQFFPLGDNSPQSKDGRLWSTPQERWDGGLWTPPPYVERRFLTGKAMFIYWPHSLRRPIPFFPNFWRMGFVK